MPDDGAYRVNVLDTWNMTEQTAAEHFRGTLTVLLPVAPYLALLVRAV